MSVEARAQLKAEEAAVAQAEPNSLEHASAQVALGITWARLGQSQRSVALFEQAWATRRKLLGPRSDEAITVGLNLATALKLDKQGRKAFEVAQRLLAVTSESHPERAHVVAVYNEVKPAGFRSAGAAARGKKKARKRRK